MMASPWLTAALTAVSVLPGTVWASDPCPARCLDTGPNMGLWSVYPNFKLIKRCPETMFYGFSLYDPVDDPDTTHRIAACSSFGTDFANMESGPLGSKRAILAEPVAVNFELGWWSEDFGLATPAIRSLVQQMREYIDHGHGAVADRPFIMYGRSGQATIGVYIGQGLLNQGISDSALETFQNNFDILNVTAPSLAMQLCGPGYDSTQTFGVMVTSNATFTPIQTAMQTWANATCLTFLGSQSFAGKATFTLPLINNTSLSFGHGTSPGSTRANSTLRARADSLLRGPHSPLQEADLAVRCGISGADFTRYNPDICASLKPKQYVCCSSGTLPDMRPKPLANGQCFSYTIEDNDNCSNLGAQFGLTMDEIEEFNKNTWGWSGCKLLFSKTTMCLSKGTPPFPSPTSNANCGPQVSGSKPPTDGSKIADLNPCPLNSCCNIWGQCGITADFCVDTNTGPPGTAVPGTYGCISNCGVDVIKGTGNGGIKLAYFQGYGMGRQCLYQDALQIDTSKFTHLHFGFGTLTKAFEVRVGDALSSYQFGEFKRIRNAKRILSFGGWAFSNDVDTYRIFRDGVKSINRLTMARNIANFIIQHDLDGVDIDWEYPGAPDLPPNINDPGKAEDGPNYLAFLAVLKNFLPGKTVAIAAPASYWYLKQFPIKEISRIVDYIVYMTYDLHGQWDAHNKYSQESCDTGNCLRSQVNLTETRQALAMITKAGVPGNKVVVGVTSYGRSFQMAEPGCWGPSCKFTGDRENSDATPGRCTGQAGYIADAEINEIIRSGSSLDKRSGGRVVTHFIDPSSNSDILVYDNNQWVGYMSENTKAVRSRLYANLGMAGTTDWASDLQQFNDPPKPARDWASFISLAATGGDPKQSTLREGKWRSFTCTHQAIMYPYDYYPSDRWEQVDAKSAWKEIVTNWIELHRDQKKIFLKSVEMTLKAGANSGCEFLGGDDDRCHVAFECPNGANGPDSGPAAQLIWQSIIQIHGIYHAYYRGLGNMMATVGPTIRLMENTFAPIPDPETNQWANVMTDLITIGALGSAAPFFNNFVKTLPAFVKGGAAFDNTKDNALMLIGQATTLAKDLLASPKGPWWDATQQRNFSEYAYRIAIGWQNSTSLALDKLLGGSDTTLNALTSLVADGKFIDGRWDESPETRPRSLTEADIAQAARKTFFGFAVPALWRRSKTYAFILDSGEDCNGNPAHKYVSDQTASETRVCHDDRLYYLVYPKGDARICTPCPAKDIPCQEKCRTNSFSAPVGLDSLSGDSYGEVTKEDIVKGSLATWVFNGRQNKALNITQLATSNNEVRKSLAGLDVNTPGVIQLPVCSPDRAFQSWDTSSMRSSPFYPCDITPGRDHCGGSTFDNQGSDVSPPCRTASSSSGTSRATRPPTGRTASWASARLRATGRAASASSARAARAAPSSSGSGARTSLT
ncbi:hypothetical protein RB593_003384 [Gaeumannomyces tritici]